MEEQAGKEYAVTKIEKYQDEKKSINIMQLGGAFLAGTAVINAIRFASVQVPFSVDSIMATLVPFGIGIIQIMYGMIDKIRLTEETKKELEQGLEGMIPEENTVEGKHR